VEKLAKDIARVLAWLEQHAADRMSMTEPEFVRLVVSESEKRSNRQSRWDQTSMSQTPSAVLTDCSPTANE
jgi:hypothetical protein